MTRSDLRRQWPAWFIAGLVAVIVLAGTIASCLNGR
jgi:hypothetical protein